MENENTEIDKVPTANSTAGAMLLGTDNTGKTRQFPISSIQNSSKGKALSTTNPGMAVIGDFYDAVAGKTYSNFLGIDNNPITIPADVDGKKVLTSKLVAISSNRWEPVYTPVEIELVEYPKSIDAVDLSGINIVGKGIKVVQDGNDYKITVPPTTFLFDSQGGLRTLVAGDYSVISAQNQVVYISASPNSYVNPDLHIKGTNQNVYLWPENFDARAYRDTGSFSVGSVLSTGVWSPRLPIFAMDNLDLDKFASYEAKGILPRKDYSISKFKTQLESFISKYNNRNQDVTLVQFGDSISTDLGWCTSRPDAAKRPPFMTEYNMNSYLEEKLRWKGQQYRRFNVDAGITFTEILGGGVASTKSDDGGIGGAWGLTGPSYTLPITRVIDGGTNAGINYLFPAGMKRCNLIIHTDYKFAEQTQITIATGNGKVQVYNEGASTWVEANGYIFSGQETAALINGTFHVSMDQKRIKMRSLTDLTAKGIAIRNIGTGRFGYWGIEFSPNEFMFTYIAASIGSQAMYGWNFFGDMRIYNYKPDMLLQQCPIINEGLQTGADTASPPVVSVSEFVQHFEDGYDTMHTTKGLIVMPYTVYGGIRMGIVFPSTGEWGYGQFEGKTVTVDTYLSALMAMFNIKNAPAVNFFSGFLDIAKRKAELDETNNIHTSTIVASGKSGDTFTFDGTHINDYGNMILFRLLEPYFNFN